MGAPPADDGMTVTVSRETAIVGVWSLVPVAMAL